MRLRDAVTVLGRFPALAGVDLDVAEGEIVLLSGPNGAGKSTVLRLLAGLVPLTSGDGRVFDRDLAGDRREVRREVAYLGHETMCYDDLTVRENLRFHACASGGDHVTADRALERVGLTRQRDVVQRLLSAGQRRRLALGVALARDARLLLLDEPHAGLDAEGRELLDGLLAGSADGAGDEVGTRRTVVLASHELERARAFAHREVTMTGGHARGGVIDAAALDPHAEPSGAEALDSAHGAEVVSTS